MPPVLVIDDDPQMLAFIEGALEATGRQAHLVARAADGLELLARGSFEAVLLEILLPEKCGVETIMEIDRRWPGTPVLAMSGDGALVTAAQALEIAMAVGAYAALRKPFSAAELARALDDCRARSDA